MREAGTSLPKIAGTLNEEGVATAQGGKKWYPSTVRAVLAQPPAGEKAGDRRLEELLDLLRDDARR